MPAAPSVAAPAADLFLIDTMGYVFRAYHAMPRLSNSRGQPTGAVLGFANMLRKLLAESRPPAIAAVFDHAGPTEREKQFPEYKANRQAMPEDLGPQIEGIRRLLEAHRIPALEYAGYEADDVIGTLARRAAEQGRNVIIVSSDKDLLQLVGERVRVLIPTRGDLLVDAAGVENLLGVRPEQVADLLALRGDAVDNIPGAPGIGEKGARDLIQRFGTVAAALERADEVERKTYRESLRQNQPVIRQSLELATIQCGLPVPLDWDAVAAREPDVEACRALYAEMEFKSLLASLPALASAPATAAYSPAGAGDSAAAASGQGELNWNAGAQIEAAETPAGAEELAAALRAPGAVALAWGESGLGLARGDGKFFLPRERAGEIRAALAAGGRRWRVHDWKDARRRLRAAGLNPPADESIEDAQLYGYLLDPTAPAVTLEALAARRLGAAAPGSVSGRAAMIAALAERLRPEVEAAGLARCYEEMDLPLVAAIEEMEEAGARLEPAALAEMSAELRAACAELEKRIHALAGVAFNVNSPKQLGQILFEKMGLPAPVRRAKSAALSTASEVLEPLAEQHEIAALVLEYRQLAKLQSTYVEALPRLAGADGRLHSTFSQVATATGRLSSSNPNLQNIPVRAAIGRRIRAAFAAAPGHALVGADYSQIELRLLAHFSGDARLRAAFASGEDIHALTAAEVFGLAADAVTPEQRRRAKAVNFGIVYGLSAFGLARQLGIGQGEAAEFIRRYFERYAGVREYLDETLRRARQEGAVRTLFGRRRPLPDILSRNANLRGLAERTAINTPLQGTAADLMRLAMIRVAARLRAPRAAAGTGAGGARLVLQVHDELVVESPVGAVAAVGAILREEMEAAHQLDVPLVVEVAAGPNWRDLTPLE